MTATVDWDTKPGELVHLGAGIKTGGGTFVHNNKLYIKSLKSSDNGTQIQCLCTELPSGQIHGIPEDEMVEPVSIEVSFV